MSERLHKVLAQHGLGSRREVERWIAEGRITLNGRIARTGDAFTEGDRVQLDGRDITKRIERVSAKQVLAYHKPQGQPIKVNERSSELNPEVEDEALQARAKSRADDEASETVMDRLPAQRGSRWVAINPMHAGDSGLLLLTNDGELNYALTRQKKWIPASYLVRVHIRGGLAHAPTLPTTLRLDDETIEFTSVSVVGDPLETESEAGNVWYQVDMARADKRSAVRALFMSHNLSVSRMTQISFGPIELTRDMPRARYQMLAAQPFKALYELAKLPVPIAPGVLNQRPRKSFKKSETDEEVGAVSAPYKSGKRGGGNRSSKPAAKYAAKQGTEKPRTVRSTTASGTAVRHRAAKSAPGKPSSSRRPRNGKH